MNTTEHLLVCLAEECAEIQQAVTKALRFGLHDNYKDSTPADDITRECCDLIAIIEMLEDADIIKKTGTIKAIEQKRVRVLHYMEYARVRGTLEAEKPKDENNINLKNLAYGFMNLSYITRVEILQKFDLLDPEDKYFKHVDILQKIIGKAKEHGCLEGFWQEVKRAGKVGE